MAKSVGGRPSVKTWEAILSYCVSNDEGNFEKFKQLMTVDEKGKKNPVFPCAQDAISALEDLQEDKPIKYTIFIRLNDAFSIMSPAEQTRIKYSHEEVEELEEETPENPEKEETLEEKVNDIKELSEKNHELLKNADNEEKTPELPDIGGEE